MFKETTGADGVVEAIPVLVVWVVAPHQDVLVAHVVRPLVDDPGPALHADGVAAANVGAELGAVAATFVAVALEVLVLVEVDLWGANKNFSNDFNQKNKYWFKHC